MRAIQDDDVAENLRDFAFGLDRELVGDVVTIAIADFHFDELVIDERLIDGGNETVIDAVFPDLDDRVELVRERAKVTTLLTAEHGAV
jgi:hypothetical protein